MKNHGIFFFWMTFTFFDFYMIVTTCLIDFLANRPIDTQDWRFHGFFVNPTVVVEWSWSIFD